MTKYFLYSINFLLFILSSSGNCTSYSLLKKAIYDGNVEIAEQIINSSEYERIFDSYSQKDLMIFSIETLLENIIYTNGGSRKFKSWKAGWKVIVRNILITALILLPIPLGAYKERKSIYYPYVESYMEQGLVTSYFLSISAIIVLYIDKYISSCKTENIKKIVLNLFKKEMFLSDNMETKKFFLEVVSNILDPEYLGAIHLYVNHVDCGVTGHLYKIDYNKDKFYTVEKKVLNEKINPFFNDLKNLINHKLNLNTSKAV